MDLVNPFTRALIVRGLKSLVCLCFDIVVSIGCSCPSLC